MTVSASKFLISPATWLATLDGSKLAMRAMPLRPLTSPSQKSATVLPTGVRAPMPVTTTRRSPSRIGRPSTQAIGLGLVARDDDRQGRLGGDLAVHGRHAAGPPEHAAQLLDRHLQSERVAGDDHSPEAALVDP